MIILGIHDGHNASVALMRGGMIEYVIQEERVVKEKNKMGFPYKSLELLFEKTGLKPSDIDKVVMNGFYMPKPTDRKGILEYYKSLLTEDKLISISKLKNKLKTVKAIANPFEEINRQTRVKTLEKLGFKKEQIEFIHHHELHASTAYYGMGKFDEDILVLTNDGAGDRVCATVNIGRDGKLEKIAEVHEHHSSFVLALTMTVVLALFLLALGIYFARVMSFNKFIDLPIGSAVNAFLFQGWMIDRAILWTCRNVIYGFVAKSVEWIDTNVVDGAVNGVAHLSLWCWERARKVQTGDVVEYLRYFALGMVVFVMIMLIV